MQVNVRGTFLCTKAVLPQMVKRRSGNIINLSSVLRRHHNEAQFSLWSDEGSDRAFTLGLAEEVKEYNIAVNAFSPDFTVTEAVKIFRPDADTSGWQLPEMWGKYAVLVAGQEAKSLTGRILDEAALKEIFGAV